MSIIPNDSSFLDNISSPYLDTISETKKEDSENDCILFLRGEEDIELTKETTLNINQKSKIEKRVSCFL